MKRQKLKKSVMIDRVFASVDFGHTVRYLQQVFTNKSLATSGGAPRVTELPGALVVYSPTLELLSLSGRLIRGSLTII